MSAPIGAFSQYALAVQQMQMSLIKSSVDMQRQAIDTLLGDGAGTVAPSPNLGHNVDVSI